MKSKQLSFQENQSFDSYVINFKPSLILCFGHRQLMEASKVFQEIRQAFPQAILAGCSTSGEILATGVTESGIVCNFLSFERTEVVYREADLSEGSVSAEVGAQLIESVPKKGLKHIFIISDGLNINGSQLVEGMREHLPEGVGLTGGLAGDGPDFSKTVLVDNDGKVDAQKVIALGFYGESLKVGSGSRGGWNSFGIERLVTKAKDNVLFELDNQPALALYKSFLGPQADQLPASGLLFPLSMRTIEKEPPLVRTILGVNEEQQSLTFAGDIPEGSYIRLMKANVDRLIDGAEEAAEVAFQEKSEFAVLISCVGRKLVMKQIVEEEVEAVQGVLGEQCLVSGFYSYGEIAPFAKNSSCELHNQTMTITTFSEF